MRGKLSMSKAERNLKGAPKRTRKRPVVKASDALMAPVFLCPRAMEIWNELAPQYDALGLLTQLDSHALGLYCQAAAEYEEALVVVENEGRIYTTANGLKRAHPAVAMANRALVIMRGLSADLGLVPRARACMTAERTPGGSKREGDVGESWCKDADGPECKTPNDCNSCPLYEKNLAVLD